MSATEEEIQSQPETWTRALEQLDEARREVIAPGERMLVLGCGTSAYVASSFAALRERSGYGETDAVHASEVTTTRRYDRVVALTRSGTTSEIVTALSGLARDGANRGCRRVAVTANATDVLAEVVDHQVTLPFADEESVVQTRFPTTILALARAALGTDISAAVRDARAVLMNASPTAVENYDHFVFLGSDWTLGLAHEAALKVREAAQAWSESYPAMDYRHGPIAIASERTLVTVFGPPPTDLVEDIRQTGATVLVSDADPLAQLVRAQMLAVDLAVHRGLDPDRPRGLSRSVILGQGVPHLGQAQAASSIREG